MNVTTCLKESDINEIIDDINAVDTDTILVIADINVWAIYEKDFAFLETIKNKRVIVWKAIDGEKTKTFAEYQSCLEFFLEKNIHRKAHLVALGGGATSDFAGFVASTILRGISWSIIPTTLLSMVDASIGGKVAINSKSGKNLIGQFHLPTYVWIYTSFIRGLPESEFLSGKGEIVKYALLDNSIRESLFNSKDVYPYIMKCAEYKKNLVERDLKESGERKILNLGHTIGHALEKIYSLPHGVSIVWGMAVLFKIYLDGKFIDEIEKIIDVLDWKDHYPPWYNKSFPVKDIMQYVLKDKKGASLQEIEIVLLEDLGKPLIHKTTYEELENKLVDNEQNLKSFYFRSDTQTI